MPQVQSAQNHTRFFPPFHFVAVPLLLTNLLVAVFFTIHDWPASTSTSFHFLHLWWIVMSLAFLLMLLVSRLQPLAAQDRLIRLEERLRYAGLMNSEDLQMASGLSIRQIIALRFASDAELPTLVQRAVAEKLTPKQIKESILVWRPDTFRV